MDIENVSAVDEQPVTCGRVSAAGQPPVMEERTFSGALFGFRRRDVLDYVRTMSENNEAYIHTLDESIAALQQELESSRAEAQTLEERVSELDAALEAGAAADTKRQEELERTRLEYQACREKLFGREQKYVQLQRECNELRRRNEEIVREMEAARTVLQQQQQQLSEAAAREVSLKEAHTRELEQAEQTAEAFLLQQREAAAKREAELQAAAQQRESELQEAHARSLQDAEAEKQQELQRAEDEKRQELRRAEEEKQQELQELGTDARMILERLGARADAEQARLARSVEQVDAELEELRTEMEQVQQQIWAAHAMIRQTTRDMDELLRRAGANGLHEGLSRPSAVNETQAQTVKGDPVQTSGSAVPETAGASKAAPVPEAKRYVPAAEPAPVEDEKTMTPEPVSAGDAPAAGPVLQAKPQSFFAEEPQAVAAENSQQEDTAQKSAGKREPSNVFRTPQYSYRMSQSSRTQTPHTTVRGARETVAEHLLDALGRLWDKR